MAMHLRIVCPESEPYNGDVAFVTVPSTDGSFGVAPRHASEICTIESGIVSICEERMSQTTRSFAVGTGYVQVSDDKVIILTDRAEDISELKASAVEARLKGFEEKLGYLSEDDARRSYLYNEISWCKLLLQEVKAA